MDDEIPKQQINSSSQLDTHTKSLQNSTQQTTTDSLKNSKNIIDSKTKVASSNHGSYILLAALLIFGLNLIAGGIGLTTLNYDIAKLMEQVNLYLGGVGTLLLGTGTAKVFYESFQRGTMNIKTKIGIGLIIASPIFGIVGFQMGLFTTILFSLGLLVLSLVFLFLGSREINNATVKKHSIVLKIFITVVAFFGAGFAGGLISALLFFLTGLHACNLTSSKCL